MIFCRNERVPSEKSIGYIVFHKLSYKRKMSLHGKVFTIWVFEVFINEPWKKLVGWDDSGNLLIFKTNPRLLAVHIFFSSEDWFGSRKKNVNLECYVMRQLLDLMSLQFIPQQGLVWKVQLSHLLYRIFSSFFVAY